MQKPKNYSRKGYICSCECPIFIDGKIVDRIMVKYEVEPNKKIDNYNRKSPKTNFRYNWQTNYIYWGMFKQVIHLSPIFDKLEKDDFVVKTSTFTRDNIQVPFIYEIQINNIEKYKKIKTMFERRDKINRLS
jgi:hypothetical protein